MLTLIIFPNRLLKFYRKIIRPSANDFPVNHFIKMAYSLRLRKKFEIIYTFLQHFANSSYYSAGSHDLSNPDEWKFNYLALDAHWEEEKKKKILLQTKVIIKIDFFSTSSRRIHHELC